MSLPEKKDEQIVATPEPAPEDTRASAGSKYARYALPRGSADGSSPPMFTVVDVLGWMFLAVFVWAVYLVFSEGKSVLDHSGKKPAAELRIPKEPGEYTDVSELVSVSLERAKRVGDPAAEQSWFSSLVQRVRRAFSRLTTDARSGAQRVRERPLPEPLDGLGPDSGEESEEPSEPEDLSRF